MMLNDRRRGAREPGAARARRAAGPNDARGSTPRRALTPSALRVALGLGAASALALAAACSSPWAGADPLFGEGSTGQGGAPSGAGGASSASSSSSSSSSASSSASSASSSSSSSSAASSSSGGPNPGVAACINEVMPDNKGALVDDLGNTPPWIELHNPTNAPIDLAGWSLTNDLATPKLSVLPQGLSLAPGAFLVLYADGDAALGPAHLGFTMQASGGVVGLYSPMGGSTTLTYPAANTNESIARVPDCCEGDACLTSGLFGTPAKTNVVIPTQSVEVLAAGSTYRYYDLGAPPPATWIDAAFNDASWASGPAPLGYGDAHIVTTVGFGPDAAAKYVTTWFRTSFQVAGAAKAISAVLEVMRDDGARAFINGVEVGRTNLDPGVIDENTLASGGATGAGETTFYPLPVDPKILVEGTNVLAIEVHQASAGSSDLGADARLSIELPIP